MTRLTRSRTIGQGQGQELDNISIQNMNLISYCIFIFVTVLFGVKTEKSIDNLSKDRRKYYQVKTKKSYNRVEVACVNR